MNLEEALQAQEQQVDALLKGANKYVGTLKAWKKACAEGHLGNLQKQSALALEQAPALVAPVQEADSNWEFDARSYLESEDWRRELQEAGEKIGLRILPENETLVSSPVVIRSQPGSNRLLLGKEAWATIRPKLTADKLKKLRDRAAASNSQEFAEALFAAAQRQSQDAYLYVKLIDIYNQFAETPGWKKENPPAVFAQAIYALQRSGIQATRAGRKIDIQGPSANAKEREVYSVIAEDGKPLRYFAVLFHQVRAGDAHAE